MIFNKSTDRTFRDYTYDYVGFRVLFIFTIHTQKINLDAKDVYLRLKNLLTLTFF